MEKNLHGGHRQRLKARFLRDGIDGFEKHNMLELLLFYAIPQRDTNPIAHALINRFGGLRGVFEAPMSELCSVDGVSEHTATLIKLIPEIWRNAASEPSEGEVYDSLNKLGKLLIKRYAGVTVETSLLVLLDTSYRILDIVKLDEGAVNNVKFDMRKAVEHIIRTNAAMVLIAHNHPGGEPLPSASDIITTQAAADTFKLLNIDFLEHIIVAGDKFEPILSSATGTFFQKRKGNAFYEKD